jgi:hypothetical protein
MLRPAEVFEELLRYREAPADDTKRLAAYNHDALCEIAKERLEAVMAAYLKYEHITYVVQGPKDHGVDVLLKETKEDEPQRYIALQVKSYAEIEDRDNDVSKQLKAGLVDARLHYDSQLKRYYVLLFGNSKKHSKRISALTNELAKAADVRVIGPRHLLTLVEMDEVTVFAIVDRLLSPDDVVRKAARAEVQGCDESELYFLLACLCWVFENSDDVLPEDFFLNNSRMHELDQQYGAETVSQARDTFRDAAFEEYVAPYSVRVRTESYSAIRALYYDLQVRYEESSDELFQHLFEFLRL